MARIAYGLPYMGSKNRFCKDIFNILPQGKRFVDLFGGGGSMTHYASKHNLYQNYLYNDIDYLTYKYVYDCITCKKSTEDIYKTISLADFKYLRDKDPYIKYIWSFGYNGQNYFCSKDKEKEKLEQFENYKNGIITVDNKGRIAEVITRVNRYLQVQKDLMYSTITMTNKSYRYYDYQDGDIVYCDIPYKGTKDYCISKFNHEQFYVWALSRDYQVYFSEYDAPTDFYKTEVRTTRCFYSSTNNSQPITECIFSNKEIKNNAIPE